MTLRRHIDPANDPGTGRFWFVMSMALPVGFIIAYPINWWLVADHLKHGMIDHPSEEADRRDGGGRRGRNEDGRRRGGWETGDAEAQKPSPSVAAMSVLSFMALTAGLALAFAG